ncbi:hypothetical protein [Duganella lactea]
MEAVIDPSNTSHDIYTDKGYVNNWRNWAAKRCAQSAWHAQRCI